MVEVKSMMDPVNNIVPIMMDDEEKAFFYLKYPGQNLEGSFNVIHGVGYKGENVRVFTNIPLSDFNADRQHYLNKPRAEEL